MKFNNLHKAYFKHLAEKEGYTVTIDDSFVKLNDTNFGIERINKTTYELLTNYTKDGKYNLMRNSVSGTFDECFETAIKYDKHFKSKNK